MPQPSERTIRLRNLYGDCRKAGIYLATYSPGDNVTRYRFMTTRSGYFSGEGVLKTTLGLAAAEAFIEAVLIGMHLESSSERYSRRAKAQPELPFPENNE